MSFYRSASVAKEGYKTARKQANTEKHRKMREVARSHGLGDLFVEPHVDATDDEEADIEKTD